MWEKVKMEFVFFFSGGLGGWAVGGLGCWGVGFAGMAKLVEILRDGFVESFLVSIVSGYLLNGIGGVSNV